MRSLLKIRLCHLCPWRNLRFVLAQMQIIWALIITAAYLNIKWCRHEINHQSRCRATFPPLFIPNNNTSAKCLIISYLAKPFDELCLQIYWQYFIALLLKTHRAFVGGGDKLIFHFSIRTEQSNGADKHFHNSSDSHHRLFTTAIWPVNDTLFVLFFCYNLSLPFVPMLQIMFFKNPTFHLASTRFMWLKRP